MTAWIIAYVAFCVLFFTLCRRTFTQRLMFTRWDYVIAAACVACCCAVAYMLARALLP